MVIRCRAKGVPGEYGDNGQAVKGLFEPSFDLTCLEDRVEKGIERV
jgi:hypothetical protein